MPTFEGFEDEMKVTSINASSNGPALSVINISRLYKKSSVFIFILSIGY